MAERKKIKLSDIGFEEEKIKKLLSMQARKQRHRYYHDDDDSNAADNKVDVQFDGSNDDDSERSEIESVDEEAAADSNNDRPQVNNLSIKTNKQQKGIIDYIYS